MDDAESWTYGAAPSRGRIGYNLGAPGDRRAADGTLWYAAPPPAEAHWGERPSLVTVPAAPKRFYHHVSRIRGGQGWPWVAASGLLGLQKIAVSAEGIDPGRPLTLRLVFVEPQYETPGSRVFSIAALGRELVRDLDIAAEAGGPWRSLAKEFPGLRLSSRPDGTGVLELDFAAKVGEPLLCGIELVQSPDPP